MLPTIYHNSKPPSHHTQSCLTLENWRNKTVKVQTIEFILVSIIPFKILLWSWHVTSMQTTSCTMYTKAYTYVTKIFWGLLWIGGLGGGIHWVKSLLLSKVNIENVSYHAKQMWATTIKSFGHACPWTIFSNAQNHMHSSVCCNRCICCYLGFPSIKKSPTAAAASFVQKVL